MSRQCDLGLCVLLLQDLLLGLFAERHFFFYCFCQRQESLSRQCDRGFIRRPSSSSSADSLSLRAGAGGGDGGDVGMPMTPKNAPTPERFGHPRKGLGDRLPGTRIVPISYHVGTGRCGLMREKTKMSLLMENGVGTAGRQEGIPAQARSREVGWSPPCV